MVDHIGEQHRDYLTGTLVFATPVLPMHYLQPLLHLCISDVNKAKLVKGDALIPTLLDALFLDPEHPRMDHTTVFGEKTDWDATKAPVQQVSTPVLRAACLRI